MKGPGNSLHFQMSSHILHNPQSLLLKTQLLASAWTSGRFTDDHVGFCISFSIFFFFIQHLYLQGHIIHTLTPPRILAEIGKLVPLWWAVVKNRPGVWTSEWKADALPASSPRPLSPGQNPRLLGEGMTLVSVKSYQCNCAQCRLFSCCF